MDFQPEQLSREPDPLDRLLEEAQWPEPSREMTHRLRRLWQSLMFNLQRTTPRVRRKKLLTRAVIVAGVASVLACAWLGVSRIGSVGPSTVAFAQVLEQIERAKSITWKMTFYEHWTSKDGRRTWLRTETRRNAYKSPGLYRETCFDEKGEIWEVEIVDAVHRRKLQVYPQRKEAVLSEGIACPDSRGPFEWVKERLQNTELQWVATRKAASGEVNVFRHAYKDRWNARDWSQDFWIDKKTKLLVEIHSPGADIYDPDKDPAKDTASEKEVSKMILPGNKEHDIAFDADLDDSLFRLEPPQGYAVKVRSPGQVTEKDMVDYFGILADFNGKTFPDEPGITNDRVNKAWDKPKKDRTPAEQKLIETVDSYIAKFQRMPNTVFVQDCTVERSFRYLGKGVKLGDKDRIVCWYKLKGAKAYRVVYGDLSVKDVAAEDLPLPVEK